MIGFMERTCRDTALPLLEPGYDTVGTHVDVTHLAAAPIGAAVAFRVKAIAVNNREEVKTGSRRSQPSSPSSQGKL